MRKSRWTEREINKNRFDDTPNNPPHMQPGEKKCGITPLYRNRDKVRQVSASPLKPYSSQLFVFVK